MRPIDYRLICAMCCAFSMLVTEVLTASTIHEVSFTLQGMQEAFASSPVNRRTPPPGAPLYLRPGATSSVDLSFPTPEPDNDRLLTYVPGDPPSYAYTIRAENAADFGFDWQRFENDLNRSLSASLRFGDSNPFNGTSVGGTRTESDYSPELPPKESWEFYSFGSREVTVDELQVVVDYYFWHPVFPELRASKIGFEIAGSYLIDVTIVAPEPSSMVLVVVAWPMFAIRRKRSTATIVSRQLCKCG